MTSTHRLRHPYADRLPSMLLALLLGSVASVTASAGSYAITDLGLDVSPADMNSHGTIVGSRKTPDGSIGVRGTAAGMVDIPYTTAAHAVNDAGQVAGNTLTGAFLDDGALQTWDGFGAYGINEGGQVSGNKQLPQDNHYWSTPLDPALYTSGSWDNLGIATVYSRGTQEGVYADLYVLEDINDTGFAVGSRRRYGLAGSSAILTTPQFRDVTYLSIPNGGHAAAINSHNMIVGATGSDSSTGAYPHAYLYDYNSATFQDLGTLNGGLSSSAADINDMNQVVGTAWLVTQPTSVYDPAKYHAFLWENGTMTDLNSLLPEGSGWILTSATAINDNGDIVGTGLKDGQLRGFLLSSGATPAPVPPAPPAVPPVAVATADVTRGGVPLTVSFSSAGSRDEDGSIVAYQWDFGDGSALVEDANPTHEYAEPGSYIAVLTVTDSQGLTATAQVEITARKARGKQR